MSMDTSSAITVRAPARIHMPSLAVGLLIMIGGTVYPPLMADAAGKADHSLALALFWAMSAGFVRGVGFVPRGGFGARASLDGPVQRHCCWPPC